MCCIVEGCTRPRDARSRSRYCGSHRGKKERWGDPQHVSGYGETQTYGAVHARIRRQLGPAKDQTCVCGKQARYWSYVGGDPDEMTEEGWGDGEWAVRYSAKMEFYRPACPSCAKKDDHRIRHSGTCPGCGEEFEAVSTKKIYCSRKCSRRRQGIDLSRKP